MPHRAVGCTSTSATSDSNREAVQVHTGETGATQGAGSGTLLGGTAVGLLQGSTGNASRYPESL